jgi:hypothetical protein
MLPLLVAALLGQAGAAEPAPPPPQETEWTGLPGESTSPVPAPAEDAAAPRAPAHSLPMPPTIEEPLSGPSMPLTIRPERPNLASLHGASPLGPGKRAVSVALGFPLLAARGMMGVTPTLDLGVEYDTLYGMMHDVRAAVRWMVWKSEGVALGVVGDAGPAFYARPAGSDFHGARWLTGRRDVNATGGLVLSIQGASPRASRFFMGARCLVALDLAPLQADPLGGVPPPVLVTPNLLTEVGLEAPVSEWVSLVFRVGLDIHGRSDDSQVMVTGSAGVVTALP